MSGRTGCSAFANPEGDLFSPVSECVGILHETDITERAKCCVVEAPAARKITNPDRDVIKHRNLLESALSGYLRPYLGAQPWPMLGKNC